MKKSTARMKALCDGLENTTVPYAWYVLTFLSLVAVRNFLEDFSDGHFADGGAMSWFYVQTYVFYATAIIILSLLLSYVTGRPVRGLTQLLMVGFLAFIPTPIIDLVVSGGKGLNMTFFLPGEHDELLLRFFTYFGPHEGAGVTIGQKVQVGIVIAGAAGYVLLRGMGAVRAALTGLATYVIIFLILSSPFIIEKILLPWGVPFKYGNIIMIQFWLLLAAAALFSLFFRMHPPLMRALLRDARPTRLSHIVLFFLLGCIIAWRNGLIEMNEETILQFPLTLLAVLMAGLYSIMMNNIIDVRIDRITNAKRPLPQKAVDEASYERASWIVLILTFLFGLTAGLRSVLLLILFIATFFLYSVPPLRLKRIPFLSKGALAMNLLITALLGFIIGGAKMIDFPLPFAAWILFGLTAHFNVIDIKDYAGDKAQGIPTLPVLLGLRDAKVLIAFCSFVAYVLLPFVLQKMSLFPVAVLLGGIQVMCILRKKYRDPLVFLISGISLVLLTGYITFFFPDALIVVGAI